MYTIQSFFNKLQLFGFLVYLFTLIYGFNFQATYAVSVTEAVNSLQTSTPGLPSVNNPKGNIGFILANIFYTATDGSKNGLIRPQYLDGIGTWTSTGANAYFSYTGSIGIGTSTPGQKLDVTGNIRSSGQIMSTVANGTSPLTVTSTTLVSNLNADQVDGLSVNSTTTNNQVNSIVRTDGSGYTNFGWINTASGDNGTTAPTRIYASHDGYIRYYSPTNFRQVLDVPTRGGTGATGTWSIGITGNAATATQLQTARTIAGVSFNGTANIAIPFANLSSKPTTAAGYGITDVVSSAYLSGRSISDANSTNSVGITLNYLTSGAQNKPLGTDHSLLTMNYSNIWSTQMAGDWRTNNWYVRSQNNSTWSNWETLLHSGNINSYSPTLTGGGASGTWSIGISGNAATATSTPLLSPLGSYIWNAATTPSGYNMGIQSSFVSSAQGFQNYGSVMTMKTYSGGGGSLQLFTPYSPTYGGTGLQVRFGNYDVSTGNSWTNWKTLLASDNFNSYSPTLTGGGASGTWSIGISGNAATATALSTNRTNYKNNTDASVVGQLMWKNYGNYHTIFDASNSTSPDGTPVNSTNSAVAWSATYPTLMGWNGVNTYGVRVDSSRLADSAGNSDTVDGFHMNQNVLTTSSPTFNSLYTGNWFRSTGNSGWYNETYGGGLYMTDSTWIRGYNGKSLWLDSGLLGSQAGLTVGYGGAGSPSGGAVIAGNVGIGNNSPSNKLHVTGNIGATGWIGAGCEGACEGGGGYSLMYADGNIVSTNRVTTPIVYDSDNSGYYSDPASTTRLNALVPNYIQPYGVGGDSGVGAQAYAIYQEGGAWSYPYPDLNIAWHTGIKIGGHSSYGGTRFYNDYPANGTEIFSVGNGDNNVRVANNLLVTGNVTSAVPTASNHLTTKAYVDAAVSAAGGGGLKVYKSNGTTLVGNYMGISKDSSVYTFSNTAGDVDTITTSDDLNSPTLVYPIYFITNNCTGQEYVEFEVKSGGMITAVHPKGAAYDSVPLYDAWTTYLYYYSTIYYSLPNGEYYKMTYGTQNQWAVPYPTPNTNSYGSRWDGTTCISGAGVTTNKLGYAPRVLKKCGLGKCKIK